LRPKEEVCLIAGSSRLGGRTASAACGLIQGLATDAVRRAIKQKMAVSAD